MVGVEGVREALTIRFGLAIEQNGGLLESASLGLPEVHEDEDSLERKPANVAMKGNHKSIPSLSKAGTETLTRDSTSSPTSRVQRG